MKNYSQFQKKFYFSLSKNKVNNVITSLGTICRNFYEVKGKNRTGGFIGSVYQEFYCFSFGI